LLPLLLLLLLLWSLLNAAAAVADHVNLSVRTKQQHYEADLLFSSSLCQHAHTQLGNYPICCCHPAKASHLRSRHSLHVACPPQLPRLRSAALAAVLR
jgi:hypothetical protein